MAQQLTFKRYNTTSALTSAKTTFTVGDVIFDKEAKIIYVVTEKTDSNVTLEPYYGNNAIKDVSCNSATITVTLSDGTTKDITINNVASAGTAAKLDAGTVGSTSQPVYFENGVPVAITGAIDNNTTGMAATAGSATYAEKLGSSTNSYTYSQISAALTGLATDDTNLSNRLDKTELALGNKLATLEAGINDLNDWALHPAIKELDTSYLNVKESINLNGRILDTAWIDSCNQSISTISAIPTLNTNIQANATEIQKSSVVTAQKLAEHEEQIQDLISKLENPKVIELATQLLTVMEAINLGGVVIKLNSSGILQIDGDLMITGETICG